MEETKECAASRQELSCGILSGNDKFAKENVGHLTKFLRSEHQVHFLLSRNMHINQRQ